MKKKSLKKWQGIWNTLQKEMKKKIHVLIVVILLKIKKQI